MSFISFNQFCVMANVLHCSHVTQYGVLLVLGVRNSRKLTGRLSFLCIWYTMRVVYTDPSERRNHKKLGQISVYRFRIRCQRAISIKDSGRGTRVLRALIQPSQKACLEMANHL